MARPLWSGAIAFGIVTIPVQLFSAVREHDIHFHQISRTDRRRIHYRKFVEGGDEEVAADDIVKGYEVRKGHYVTFDDDELKRIAARRSKVIDIESFVHLADIDPRYYDQLYYLFPGDHGDKPYRLLHEALQRADQVGVARLVMHSKEHLVVVRAFADVLGIQTLRFADEIGDPRKIGPVVGKVKVAAKELALASQLIDSMSGKFAPAAYKDEYLGRVKAAIARKAKGQTLAIEEDDAGDEDDGKVLDLMAALDRSLKARSGGKVGRKAPQPAHEEGEEESPDPAPTHGGKRGSAKKGRSGTAARGDGPRAARGHVRARPPGKRAS
jgi:DNA end-binding protein Ku